jgi:Mn-dependent DtxR family transcriptional regulator
MTDSNQKRVELLLALYEMSGGSTLQGVLDQDLMDRLKVDRDQFQKLAFYLRDEYLINFRTFSSIALDHRGLKRAEEIMEETYSQKKRKVLEAIADQARMSNVVPIPGLAQRLGMSEREVDRYCSGLSQDGSIWFEGGDLVQMLDAGWEALEPPKPTAPTSVSYNMWIDKNFGAAGQGTDFSQYVTVHNKTEFDEAIDKLLKAVDTSKDISIVQKVTVTNDIKTLQQLGQVEQTPEVIEAASGKIEFINSVVSSTADLVSLGMVIIPIIRAFFGL